MALESAAIGVSAVQVNIAASEHIAVVGFVTVRVLSVLLRRMVFHDMSSFLIRKNAKAVVRLRKFADDQRDGR